jgi:hypothetical protein
LWLLEYAQEGQFLLTDAVDVPPGHESLDGLLDGDDLLPLQVLGVVEFKILIARALLLLVQLLNLPLLVVGCLERPHDALSTTFDLLDDPNSSLHIRIQGRSFFDDLLLGQVGLLEVNQELVHDLVAFHLILIAVIHEIPGDVHLDLRGPHAHLQQKLVQVDVLGSDGVGVGVVADEIEFELDHAQHGGLEHVLEEHALLRVDHLVVAILEDLVAVDVFDVEVGVEAEPLLVLALVLDLHQQNSTPFSPRFSSSGSNSSWMF